MKFFKGNAVVIMIAAATLFACSKGGDQGSTRSNSGSQPRGYYGDQNKQDDTSTQNKPSQDQQPGAGSAQQPQATQPQQDTGTGSGQQQQKY